MHVLDVLDERITDLHTTATTKAEVLSHLAAKLKTAGYIDNTQSFIADIYQREHEGITGIGGFIAIPHGKSDSVTRVGIAIAKLDHEIAWESLDGKGVRLVFLFAVSNNHEYARNHMLLLADIARRLGNDEIVENLLKATTFAQLKEAFT